MKNQQIIRSVLAAELILLIPLIAMMFAEEVDWGILDFIVVGVLLAGIGFSYQLIVHGIKTNSRLVVVGIILAGAMILIWLELAVGVFNSPFAGS
jgi:hypothetical protein